VFCLLTTHYFAQQEVIIIMDKHEQPGHIIIDVDVNDLQLPTYEKNPNYPPVYTKHAHFDDLVARLCKKVQIFLAFSYFMIVVIWLQSLRHHNVSQFFTSLYLFGFVEILCIITSLLKTRSDCLRWKDVIQFSRIVLVISVMEVADIMLFTIN